MAQPSLQWSDPIEIEAGRTSDYKFKLYKADKTPAALAGTDVVRFKLSGAAGDATPKLDLDSVATAAGSVVTVLNVGVDNVTPAEVQVRFAQDDTKALARREPYHGELTVVDDSETAPPDAIKRAGHGPVVVKPASGGDVGLA